MYPAVTDFEQFLLDFEQFMVNRNSRESGRTFIPTAVSKGEAYPFTKSSLWLDYWILPRVNIMPDASATSWCVLNFHLRKLPRWIVEYIETLVHRQRFNYVLGHLETCVDIDYPWDYFMFPRFSSRSFFWNCRTLFLPILMRFINTWDREKLLESYDQSFDGPLLDYMTERNCIPDLFKHTIVSQDETVMTGTMININDRFTVWGLLPFENERRSLTV